MKLVSACLLGINCKHDGTNNKNEKVLELAKKEILIPVCPEQLGGLPTPRERHENRGEKVVSKTGKDRTKEFKKGAVETLVIAKMLGVKEAILKARSPSCGCGEIYDGTFSGKTKEGDGLTTRILKEYGISCKTEENL